MFFKKLALKTKLLVVASLSLVFTVGIVLWFNYTTTYKDTMAVYRATQIKSTEIISSTVKEYVFKYASAVTTFGETFRAANTQEAKTLYGPLIDKLVKEFGLSSIYIAFEDGTTFSDSASQMSREYKTRPWYRGINFENEAYVSSVYQNAATKQPRFSITYVIHTEDGVKGLVSFNMDVDMSFLDNFVDKSINGELYVFDFEYNVIYSEDKSKILKASTEVFPPNVIDYLHDGAKFNSNKEIVTYVSDDRDKIVYLINVKDAFVSVMYTMDMELMVENIHSNMTASLIFSIVLLVIANILISIVIHIALKDVKNIQRQITDISSNKNLKAKIATESTDELADIAGSVNGLLEAMNQVVGEVRNSIIEVASANNQLAATMEELSSTFNSQAHQVSEIVNEMDEISEVSRTTSEALSKNMSSLESTANITREEADKLDKVTEDMQLIEQDTVALAETIKNLSASSTEIGNILSVINDIANQTNLLALNAAIEAARAGEAGRGFAVVADEVRKLAERTQDATKEIETIISGLQQESENASQAMGKSIVSVQEGAGNIQNVTGEIKRAVDQVTMLYTGMQPVSDAVSNQYDMVQNVVSSTTGISAGIEESNSAVNEVSNTVGHLQQRTEFLKQLIEQFK